VELLAAVADAGCQADGQIAENQREEEVGR
jgi:hypothetical protein